jgi:heme-degrading monooxygenase HmoA
MFMNIINFPLVVEGKDEEFREWFSWSTEQYKSHNGFISRKLLTPRVDGNYVGVVEHESYETFMAMHTSSTQAEARKRVDKLLQGNPTPHFFTIVAE